MENTSQALATKEQLIEKLNKTVVSVISANGMQGFEKAFLIAEATAQLKAALTSEYMKPIMELQGNRLGFRTDKDRNGGYPVEVVKNCLIEAVLTGVQPFGNQFNIIAGNCYITKEGFGYLLKNFPGLDYDIIPGLPRVGAEKKSAAVLTDISWTLGGIRNERKIDLPIKIDEYASVDSIIGKATRKARAWLFWRITGVEVGEGDVADVDHKVMSSKVDLPTVEELNKLIEEKMEFLGAKEFEDAKRIVANKEEASYRKLFNLLISKTAE